MLRWKHHGDQNTKDVQDNIIFHEVLLTQQIAVTLWIDNDMFPNVPLNGNERTEPVFSLQDDTNNRMGVNGLSVLMDALGRKP